MRKITLVAIAMLATACGPNLEESCQNYIDAATACANEAFGGGTTTTASTTGSSTGGALPLKRDGMVRRREPHSRRS